MPITIRDIERVLEKKERKYMVKTKYGRSLGEKYTPDMRKIEEAWKRRQSRRNSELSPKS